MNNDVLVRVEGVSKKFCRSLKKSLWYGMQDLGNELRGRRHGGDGELRPDEFWAVKDVSFELKRGECLGLIGRNGAGKTTLLRILNGLIKPNRGQVEMRGRVGALIALGAGFNPVLTGRENVYVNAVVHGLGKNQTDRVIEEIIEFSGIRDFIDAPVQTYSSGMQVRLGFSIYTALNPDIFLIDEILAVGDVQFRTRCKNKIKEKIGETAVIFVSHNMHDIAEICNKALVVNDGKIDCFDNVRAGVAKYEELALADEVLPQDFDDGMSVNEIAYSKVEEIHSLSFVARNSKWEEIQWRVNVRDGGHGQLVEFRAAKLNQAFGVTRVVLQFEDPGLTLAKYQLVLYCVELAAGRVVFRREILVRADGETCVETRAPILRPLKSEYLTLQHDRSQNA